MSRSPLTARVARALRIAQLCEERRISTADGYGSNARLLVGFAGRPWLAQGSNGTV